MYLRPGQKIGWEQHANTTQYFAVVSGTGRLYSGATSDVFVAETRRIEPGSKWLIEPQRWHDVEAGNLGLHLLTIYFPAEHPAGTVDRR